MKLQHIAIIFVIIIVPISLVLSNYISSHVRTIEYQSACDSSLINATHDSMRAFQLNTQNNELSDIANSKIRDIEASINVFYSSLSTNLGAKGYTKEDLKSYIPAILFTLYDGYYIYSNNYDSVSETYKYGLKPFIAYSCRYGKGNNNDFVVNYTLDNTITIIGKVKGEYVTKTGHLILQDTDVTDIVNPEETLREYIIILEDDTTAENVKAEEYEYVVYSNQKIYKENNWSLENDPAQERKYFKYSSQYKKDYITSAKNIQDLNDHYQKTTSAKKYYEEAKEFTDWVNENLNGITQEDAVDVNGNQITTFQSDLGTEKIFDTSNEKNNPILTSSTFNDHRMNVIRYTIETNLVRAMNSYTQHSAYAGVEFAMPKLSEQDWNNLENNICEMVFMQGLPLGGKLYSNYCVVSNNTNKECVNNSSIYILSEDTTSGKKEYHQPGCKTLISNLETGRFRLAGAYSAIDFKRKSVSLTGDDVNGLSQIEGIDEGKYAYYYPQPYEACYDCIVTASDAYTTDDIIYGHVIDQFGRTQDDYGDPYGEIKNRDGNDVDITNLNGTNLQKYYLTALARARYDLYLVNGYFGNY